jgi:poly-gamma-glutamate capsule biosynthesis protein CapA/YwtB (metallophosphatase superfamily)
LRLVLCGISPAIFRAKDSIAVLVRIISYALASASLLTGVRLRAADPFAEETLFRRTFDVSPVSLRGRVVDGSGSPVPDCTLSLASGETGIAAPDGTFALSGLSRSNQLLTVTASGYYRQLVPVQLFVPLTQTNVLLPPVVLWPDAAPAVRFLFGGDTAFGRRMLDPEERAPRDQLPMEHPGALICVSDPLPGTLDVVRFVKPLFHAADYPILNFESVVTLDPSSPHWQKRFVYFTLPDSLAALQSLNIEYVGLGNNHTYDYLESGVSNTCQSFAQAGIHYSGLGSNSSAALLPYRTNIKGTPYSFLAMTSIGGEQHATNYVAGPTKGGAAYVESKFEARQAIATEKASGQATLLQLHIGDEYAFEPTAAALKWMKFGVDAGADLVVSHHPHVAQGFGMHRGVLLVHCLGNLFFDQDRLETMFGLVAIVDMEGPRLRRAWGTPIYLEDYRPRLLCGNLTPVLLRRISEFSQQLRVFPYNSQAWIANQPSQYSFVDRRIIVPMSIGTNGWAAIDLRNVSAPEESLVRIEAEVPGLIVRPGRDLMNFGDFEDVDVDLDRGEALRWDFNTNATVSLQNPFRGTAALCLYRKSTFASEGVASFRNRVRVMGDAQNAPNKDLSLFGAVRGQGAGRIRIVSRFYASEGNAEFGEELSVDHPGGTFGWQPFVQDLHMPPDANLPAGDPLTNSARALRVFLRHSPPATGSGYAWFDEIAVVNWEEALDPLTGPVLNSPHARDFLRLQGSSGTYHLALTFRRYRPVEADAAHGPDLTLETERPDQSPDRVWFRPTSVGSDDTLRLVVRNRGDQPLIVSGLAFSGGHATDFSARWLAQNNAQDSGPALVISPKTAARLEVRFAPTIAGHREAALQFQSNDPDEAQSAVSLIVGGDAYGNCAVRSITRNRTASPTIQLQIPPTAPHDNLIEEQLPPGLTPLNFSASGFWDASSRTLQWLRVFPGTTVGYSVTGSSSVYAISGRTEWSGESQLTQGDNTAILVASPDADADALPDWWEHKFFDSRTGALGEVDSDGDGENNWAEFLAGTHPLDGGFQAQQWSPFVRLRLVDDQVAELKVIGFEGDAYQVEDSNDLQSWRLAATNLLSGETVTLPWSKRPTASTFYRAKVEQR